MLRLFTKKRLLWGMGILLMLWGIFWFAVPFLVNAPPGLEHEPAAGAIVLDRHGKRLATLSGPDYYYAEPVPLEQVPQMLIKATLAAEDKRFYAHGGVDFLALGRAIFSGLTDREFSSGASTVTQQLAKIANPPADRNVLTKIKEVFQARRLEMTMSKDAILQAYLNRLDYGNLRRGPVTAARFYFGRELDELSLAQTALLAGLPQGPGRLNPLKHPQRALKRRNTVLQRMLDEGMYPAEMIERAMAEPLFAKGIEPERMPVAPHVVSALSQSGRTGTLRTTLDARLQIKATQIVSAELEKLKERNVSQAAVVVVENATGNILCLIGSADRTHPKGGLLDGTALLRSPGSTLKPFVYAQAFMHGAFPGTILPDVPTTYRSFRGLDAPRNYNGRYMGPISMRTALACSQNIPAMKALEDYGGVEQQLELLRALGVLPTVNATDADRYGLGLAIGNAEVRLRDLTAAYACLARGGLYLPLNLEDAPENVPPPRRVLPESVCYMVADILADRVARRPAFGNAPLLNLPFRYACKTGTSSDFRDNWCMGFTSEVSVGVWVGNFDVSPMRNVGGMDGAAPIFAAIMRYIHEQMPAGFPTKPAGVEYVRIDVRTGKRMGKRTGTAQVPPHYVRTEPVTPAGMPPPAAQADYDEQGRALLDSRYTQWYKSPDCNERDAFALAADRWAGITPRVLHPPDRSRLALDPELPGGGDKIELRSNLPAGAIWSSPTLKIDQNGETAHATLTPGTHTITAHHPRLNLTATTTITVREM